METIAHGITELIGSTPMLEPVRFTRACGLQAKLFVKLEGFNPAGSAKDRIARAMIEEAEKNGQLKPGSVIIEPTSGNTGIGLAAVATSKGYRLILTMPETMSVERRNLLKAYGAQIVLTSGSEGMAGAIRRAEELRRRRLTALFPASLTIRPIRRRILKLQGRKFGSRQRAGWTCLLPE